MIAPNPNFLCKQAVLYYYDFLCNESRALIPEFIVNHIEQCQQCREQINKLKEALSQADGLESEQEQVRSAVTTMLKLHFDYVGKPITCNIVKPFLPCLLDPALEIRIPTPIMTHLHNCQQCSEDLDIIQSLKLNRKQLCRLSQLFADKRGKYNISCWQAHAAILTVLSMGFRETNEEVLKHICMCRYCRKLLYEYREAARREFLREKREQKFPCEEVSATDIFDYVVPYGLDPSNDQYAKFRKSFTSHVIACPTCLARMQHLHETIYYIAERPDSDVVTIYHIDESAKAEARSESDDIYAGFPIRVETANREDEVNAGRSASTIAFGDALKQKVSAMNLKPLVKTAVAVVALILIGVVLLLYTPTAKAVAIERIYKALVKVKNVHISSFVPDKEEPIQEQWVSRTFKIQQIKTKKKSVLWDFPNRVRKTKYLDTDLIETKPLSDGEIAERQEKISGYLGLMPDISKVRPDGEWSRVTDDEPEVTDDIEVYDLAWDEKAYDGSLVFRKWRVFVDPGTNLPHRVEWYKKLASDDEFVLETIMVVEYLSDSEIRTVIKNLGF